MSKTVASSWNDFDPLEHAIVGRADFTCIPPSEPATEAKIPEDSNMRGMWGPRPQEAVEKANAELDHLVSVPEGRGIRVDRPIPIQWNQAVVTPDFMTGSSFGCMPPRDVLLTVGREILSAPPAHNEPPPLCYSSVWLSMNVLVLDPKTVVVEASEVYQQEQLDGFGFEVIPVPFRGACPFGGGLHCATGDVFRRGDCEDYFPKQIPGTRIRPI